MFTGIIEDQGSVTTVERRAGSLLLSLSTNLDTSHIALGDSIAVNGACLTVTRMATKQLTFDISHETVAATTLQFLRVGQQVHLEQALAVGGRLGGHFVTGHVDGMGQVVARSSVGQNLDLSLQAPADVVPYLVAKGSIAIDGVSLTVNAPEGERFRVTLVPHTLAQTHLSKLQPTDRVNLEADILGKYIRHFSRADKSEGLNEEFLARHGFMNS